MNLSAEIWCENLQSRRYLRLELLLSFANSTNLSHVTSVHFSNLFPFYFQWRREDQNWRFQVHFAAQPAWRPRCILPEVLPNTDPPGHKAPSLWGADRPGSNPGLRLDLCKMMQISGYSIYVCQCSPIFPKYIKIWDVPKYGSTLSCGWETWFAAPTGPHAKQRTLGYNHCSKPLLSTESLNWDDVPWRGDAEPPFWLKCSPWHPQVIEIGSFIP